VSLETIDQLLSDWRTKLDMASQNLLDLQSFPTYQRLAGESGFPKAQLAGQTATLVEPALAAMNGLFQHFELLSQTLNQAQALRQTINGKRGQDEKIVEITTLLSSDSIQLPLVEIPLAQRSLLSASQDANRVKPIDLMMAMVKSFEAARDVVLAVDKAWTNLEPKLVSSFQQIQQIQAEGAPLGVTTFPELAEADRALGLLHDRVAADPLGVQDEFESAIAPLIHRAQSSLNQVVQQRQQIVSGITQAAALLPQLQSQHQQALSQYQEALEKVTGVHLQTPLAPETLEALVEWQQVLATKLAQGIVQPLAVGLQNWRVKFDAAQAVTMCAIASATNALNQRQELRGRLHALQAKAQARGRIEDPELVQLADRSQQILFSRPSDLGQANELLIQYERRLNSVIGTS
jgi:hypothetical protein